MTTFFSDSQKQPQPSNFNYSYHGIGGKGGARVVQEDPSSLNAQIKLIVRGRLAKLHNPLLANDDPTHALWILIHTTPGYEKENPDDERIECMGLDGETYRLVGKIFQNKRIRGAAPLQIPAAIETGSISDEHSSSTFARADGTLETQLEYAPAGSVVPKRRVRNTVNSDVKAELELIWAAQRAGSDPQVKMRHVTAIFLMSPQSVYRKIQRQEFSPPFKRGRGSFWYMSQLEAYLSTK